MSGSITINNVQATDAGFYTCSSNCQQVRYDQISYYLQPVANGQPIDTTQNFIPIPPFPQEGGSNIDRYYVVVNENLDQHRGSVLSKLKHMRAGGGGVFYYLELVQHLKLPTQSR